MPKLYIYAGMVFLFYSDDHTPIHLHVRFQGSEMKAVLRFATDGCLSAIEWTRVAGKLPPAQVAKAERLLKVKASDIVKKWNDRFVFGKDIKPERILRIPK
ncbi:MAG: DUF4160 domain-containing protein [Flavobacteriales bacterium]|nr:MAG: DUF4160 domain-containing protein [Flavobacteriales bacterium]